MSVPSVLLLGLLAAPRGGDGPELLPSTQGTIPVTRGVSVRSLTLDSALLGQTRQVHLVLPASFASTGPERRYPVVIVLDGEDNVPSAAAVSAELARNGQIPELLLVALPNVPGASEMEGYRNRVHDLTPPGLSVSGSSRSEGGDRFLDFVEQELLPAVERQFRGGGPRVFVGHSSGGILATWVAATRPGFRAVVALDAPTHLDDEWLPRRLMERAAKDPTPLRYVSCEARFGWREEAWRQLVAAAPASWRLHRETLAGETHETIGMLGMYLGLREVFADYAQRSAPVSPTTRTLPYYDGVAADLGAPLVPPRSLLRAVTEDLLMEGRGTLARAAYERLAAGYGAPADAAELLARIAEVERRPPPTETVEGLLATPFPRPEEAAAFLGEWVGDLWTGADEAHDGDQRLRLWVEGGELRGETRMGLPGGEELLMPWSYLRVTPAGLTWGYMNGMRPRGMLLYEGVLAGDSLSGVMRFGGVDFRRPDGSGPPEVRFAYRRAPAESDPRETTGK